MKTLNLKLDGETHHNLKQMQIDVIATTRKFITLNHLIAALINHGIPDNFELPQPTDIAH